MELVFLFIMQYNFNSLVIGLLWAYLKKNKTRYYPLQNLKCLHSFIYIYISFANKLSIILCFPLYLYFKNFCVAQGISPKTKKDQQ